MILREQSRASQRFLPPLPLRRVSLLLPVCWAGAFVDARAPTKILFLGVVGNTLIGYMDDPQHRRTDIRPG